ncbi:MAG: glycosyltransferase [bacterium]|nr:glycosyltransferase [bacterium]
MPETSIVIRTLNEEEHIGNLLSAIKKQTYKNYEIIIVDSGSTDKTLEIAQKFPVNIVKINSWDFTFGYALNIGCQKSRGKYLVFASAHVIPVDKDWLANLIAPFGEKKVAMVYGRQLGHDKSKFSEKRDFRRIFSEFPSNSRVFLGYANNANAAIRKKLWQEKNFDEYLFGLEDIDWAKHMTEKGYLVHYEPKAAIYHIHTEEWHQVFNRYRREAIAAYRIGLKHPPQARLEFTSLITNLIGDTLSSFPNWSLSRLEEILRFRYYQWKGNRQGWFRDRNLDFNREKYNIFYPTSNKAVVIKNKNQAIFEEIPTPQIKPGEILIKVDYVGVCRTDLEVYEGTLGYYRDGLANYPIVPGHEFSGTIVKIGANNKYRERFKVGDAIVGECILSRGENSERREVGVINHNGAYSKFVVIPGSFIHLIPPGLDSKIAAMAEPLAVVLRAIRRLNSRLHRDSKIAVIGAGSIGHLCAKVFHQEGYKVTVFDKNSDRIKHLDNISIETSSSLDNLNDFNIIVEATGSKEVLEKVMKNSRLNSTILLLGFPYGDIGYNFEDLVGKEKVVVGSVGAESEDFTKALGLLSKLDMTPFTQVIFSLEDFAEAWQVHKSSKHLKILLKP